MYRFVHRSSITYIYSSIFVLLILVSKSFISIQVFTIKTVLVNFKQKELVILHRIYNSVYCVSLNFTYLLFHSHFKGSVFPIMSYISLSVSVCLIIFIVWHYSQSFMQKANKCFILINIFITFLLPFPQLLLVKYLIMLILI